MSVWRRMSLSNEGIKCNDGASFSSKDCVSVHSPLFLFVFFPVENIPKDWVYLQRKWSAHAHFCEKWSAARYTCFHKAANYCDCWPGRRMYTLLEIKSASLQSEANYCPLEKDMAFWRATSSKRKYTNFLSKSEFLFFCPLTVQNALFQLYH